MKEGGVRLQLLKHQLAQRLLCVPMMLALVLLLHTLRLPSPVLLLMIPVVWFTYTGGIGGGVLSGLPVLAYVLYDALGGTAGAVNPAGPAIAFLSLAAMIYLTGRFKTHSVQCLASLEERNEALFRMASTDKLTGISTRYSFFDLAETAYQSSSQLHSPLAVLFIDADHFKTVNDTWGHRFGDQVLLQLSEVIRSCLRGSDLCCRYGGEEFLVLLLHSDRTVACAVAERIIEQVRALRFPDCPEFQCTVSIGITVGIPSPAQRLEDFINDADCAMYQAKKAGRDQAVLRLLPEPIISPQ